MLKILIVTGVSLLILVAALWATGANACPEQCPPKPKTVYITKTVEAKALGFPNLPHRLTWYGVQFKGFLELPACLNNKCYLRLTSDDGSKLTIGGQSIVNNDGLHAPLAKIGSVNALAGWHSYQIDYWQGPATQIALALEVSVDGGVTYTVVSKDQLKYEVQ